MGSPQQASARKDASGRGPSVSAAPVVVCQIGRQQAVSAVIARGSPTTGSRSGAQRGPDGGL